LTRTVDHLHSSGVLYKFNILRLWHCGPSWRHTGTPAGNLQQSSHRRSTTYHVFYNITGNVVKHLRFV